MRRRALLSALPAVGGLAFAGCLDGVRSTVGDTPDDRGTDDGPTSLDPSTTPDGEPAVTLLDGWKPEMLWLFRDVGADSVTRGEGVDVVGIGSGDDSHWVTIAAEHDDPIEVSVAVGTADGESLYETTAALSNTRYVGVRFAHVDRYRVHVETADHEWATTVPEGSIDCNESGRVVLLAEDGDIRTTALTTDMACR